LLASSGSFPSFSLLFPFVSLVPLRG
jgi:hypothetical protein